MKDKALRLYVTIKATNSKHDVYCVDACWGRNFYPYNQVISDGFPLTLSSIDKFIEDVYRHMYYQYEMMN